MNRLVFLFFILNIIFFNCDNETPTIPENKQICIQGFLHADKPVNDIRITSLVDFEDGKTDYYFPPVNDATAYLYKNNNEFILSPSPGDSGYYHYNGSDLKVELGDTFKLKVNYKNNIATAETTIPDRASIDILSTDTLYIKRNNFNQHSPADTIKVQYNSNYENENEPEYYSIFQFKNVTQNYFIKNENTSNYFGYRGYNDGILTFYAYPYEYEDEITEFNIYIINVHQEYLNFFRSSYISTQYTSRSFNRNSNFDNAFGLFTGVAADSTTFYIKLID